LVDTGHLLITWTITNIMLSVINLCTGIFWTELSCWYRRYSNKATSSLQKSDGRYHDLVERYKISISQMTFGFFLLHIFCVCSIINDNSTGIDYTYMNNTTVYYKRQELLTSPELLDSLLFFLWWDPCCLSSLAF
jgi:hypothetical protein